MDRTTEDKLMSNVSTLKNELDNFYLNGITPEVTALAARICDLAGGHSAELEALAAHRQHANALARRVQELEEAIDQMFSEAAQYDDSWSVPQFLEDEPTVAQLRELAHWQEATE